MFYYHLGKIIHTDHEAKAGTSLLTEVVSNTRVQEKTVLSIVFQSKYNGLIGVVL